MERHSSHFRNAPYARKEGRKSIFSKVRDSMKDILSPSWISDLMHGAKKESPTSVKWDPNREAVPGASAEEDPSGYRQTDISPFQNPSQVLINGQPRTTEFHRTDITKDESGMMPFEASIVRPSAPPASLPVFTSAQLPLSRITEKSDSVMTQDDTMSQQSDRSRSTSGCSSMIPQTTEQPKRNVASEKRKAADDKDLTEGSNLCSSSYGQPLAKRLKTHLGGNISFSKHLGDSFMQKPSAAVAINRPSFNSSLFGSPLNNESSLLGSSFHESSFYSGKTTYGGRSSVSYRSQNTNLNLSLPSRFPIPVKAFMKAKPRQNLTMESVTSSTARRIMEVLDKMPTPLNDAKKIPLIVPQHWNGSPFPRERKSPGSGPPTQMLNISAQATIIRNRQVSFLGVQSPTQMVPEYLTQPLVRQDTVLLDNESGVTGKIKRDKSYHRGSAVRLPLDKEDTVVLPDLQTDFTLPVNKMPKFNFTKDPQLAINLSKTPLTQPVVIDSKLEHNFTFSSPIPEIVPINKPTSPQVFGNFKFSSPISVDKTDTSSAAFRAASPAAKPMISGPSTDTISIGLTPSAAIIQNAGLSNVSETSTTSSFFSGLSGVAPYKGPDLHTMFKPTGCNCDVCLLKDKDNAEKCIACQTVRLCAQSQKGSTSNVGSVTMTQSVLCGKAVGTQSTNGPDLSKLFNTTGWTCDTCLLNNKIDVEKHVALQTVKSSGQKPKGSLLPSNWICGACLIQNKADAVVCGACKATKTVANTKSLSLNNSEKSDSLFMQFKSPVGQWECEVCLVPNKPDTNICVACQTLKPLKAFKHPPGDWVCDTCLVSNKGAKVNCVSCNYARPGPPRTQAVPSCVKAYLISHGIGASSMLDAAKTSNITLCSAGEFAFNSTGAAEDTSKASGFKFDESDSKDHSNKFADSKMSEGGFKFSASTEMTNSGGFKFGTKSLSENNYTNKSVIGTVKFSDVNSSPAGLKFNVDSSLSEKKTESKENCSIYVDFQDGKSDNATAKKNSEPESSVATSILFPNNIFSQRTESNSKDPLQTTVSLPGGFTFKPSSPITSTKINEGTSSAVTISSQSTSTGGFNFSTAKSSGSLLPGATPVGGFIFPTTKITESSSIQGSAKPVPVGAFGQKPTVTSTSSSPAVGGFNFVTKSEIGQKTELSDRDDASRTDTPFSFNQKPASTATPASTGAFTFGATPLITSNNNVVFGLFGSATPSTTGATQTVFGQMNTSINSPSVFQFGQKTTGTMFNCSAISSAQSGTTVPVLSLSTTPSFNVIGQKSEALSTGLNNSLFKFGQQQSQPVAASTPTFGASTGFGPSSGSVFMSGGNAPSTVFGFVPPPAYGAGSNTAQGFGGGGFGLKTDATAAQTQNSSMFQFGKPANHTQSTEHISGFPFSAPTGPGTIPSFNFTAQTPSNAPTLTAPGCMDLSGDGRKIKKAVRKIRRP